MIRNSTTNPQHIQFTKNSLREANLGSLPGHDDITRTVLPNGITVLTRANFNSPSVVINGYLTAGGLFDPDDKLGLADFTASSLMRGSLKREFQEIYEALESIGASLGIAGGTHTTVFRGRALAEDLPVVVDLLGEVLRQPAFPPEYIEKLRAQLLTSLAIRAQDTNDMASLVFDQLVYDGHPYSRPQDGYPETIHAIQRADLQSFHAEQYGPNGMTIAVVGAVEASQVVDIIGQALGDWQHPGQPMPPELPELKPIEHMLTQKVTLPGKSQADVIMGAAGPPRSAPDYLAASLGNNILGQFGMMGRIGEAVREKAGLAYYASSSLSGGLGPGPWYVSMGVDPANIERAVELARQEIAHFTSELVSGEELSDTQEHYVGRLPLSLESNGGVAAALINLERYELGLDYYRQYPELVQAVTTADVLQAARHYLDPERLVVSVAGP
jgi:zinc protease